MNQRYRQKGKAPQDGRTSPAETQTGLPARLAAAQLAGMVTGNGASLDEICSPENGYGPWLELGERDRALARAITLATLRHRCRIRAMLARCWRRPPPQGARLLGNALETAVAQIAFMEVPASAAVNIAVAIISADARSRRFAAFANAVLRKIAGESEALLEATSSQSAFPDWFQRRLQRDHGRDKTREMSAMFAAEPYLDLNGKPGFDSDFADAIKLPGPSLRIASGMPAINLPGYEKGSWWVQDLAAAQPAILLERCLEGGVQGRPVADLCAAPGGKTMQLVAMGAQVTSVDISSRRLEKLRENLARTGLAATIVCADLLEWQPSGKFDAILLDAPCTASGTIRRHPDIVWNSREGDIATLAALQQAMIRAAADWLNPGGLLAYANCSLFKTEGEDLVASLDVDGLEHVCLDSKILPGLEACINGRGDFRSLLHHPAGAVGPARGMDGFFCSLFRKT